MDIREAIQERILFCDGGMGSLLQARGLKPGELPGTWNITHPEALVEQNGVRLVVVVMKAGGTHYTDTKALLDYGFALAANGEI